MEKIILVLLIFLASFTHAQQNKKISFSCVVWEKMEDGPLFFNDGNKLIELKFRPRQRSKVYEFLNRGKGLQIFKKVINSEGKLTLKLVGQSKVEFPSSEMLFFIEKRKTEDPRVLPYFLVGMDDSVASFPVGAFEFVNYSKNSITVHLPKTQKTIRPRKMAILTPKLPDKGGMIPVYITNKKKEKLFGSRFYGQPKGRKIVFISDNDHPSIKLKMRFLPQIMPTSLPKPNTQQ